MQFQSKNSLLRSFISGFKGLGHVLHERNFFIQFCLGIIAVFLGLILRITVDDWIVLLLLIGLVLGSEMINTSLEYLLDLLIPQFHLVVGKIKNTMAGAVLLFSLTALVVGFLIFMRALLKLIV